MLCSQAGNRQSAARFPGRPPSCLFHLPHPAIREGPLPLLRSPSEGSHTGHWPSSHFIHTPSILEVILSNFPPANKSLGLVPSIHCSELQPGPAKLSDCLHGMSVVFCGPIPTRACILPGWGSPASCPQRQKLVTNACLVAATWPLPLDGVALEKCCTSVFFLHHHTRPPSPQMLPHHPSLGFVYP